MDDNLHLILDTRDHRIHVLVHTLALEWCLHYMDMIKIKKDIVTLVK